jgi:hypothetical protein
VLLAVDFFVLQMLQIAVMQPIETELSYAGHFLRQIWRQGDVAVYERSLFKNAEPHELELITIVIQPEGKTPTGSTVPEREAYPSASQWGKLAWSFPVRMKPRVMGLAEKLIAIKEKRGTFVREALAGFRSEKEKSAN